MVVPTVTYSIEIYTPNTNVENLSIVRVQITGEEFIQTERKRVIDGANRPEANKQGYVKFQTLETVKCDHRSKFSNLSNWKEEA